MYDYMYASEAHYPLYIRYFTNHRITVLTIYESGMICRDWN
jgi:hypothetical protein